MEVPVIDIGPFDTGDSGAKQRIARCVRDACETIGFLIVEGHGVPEALYGEALAISLEFFALPSEEKCEILPPEAAIPRGYQMFATRRLAITRGIETPPDLREQFFMGPLQDLRGRYVGIPEALPFYQPNLWPQRPAAFRSVFEALYQEHERLALRLMRIFALALSLDEGYFDSKIEHHFSTGTSSHYPGLDAPPESGQLRCGEHTDFGSLTILRPDAEATGLEVRDPDGAWSEVWAKPEQLVVNIGDMMERWTNDRWRSTVHRVVNPTDAGTGTARQSLAFFLHPNYDTEIQCIETCASEDEPPRYGRIRAGDLMREKLIKRTT